MGWRSSAFFICLAAQAGLVACGRDGEADVDPATIDRGAYRNPSGPPPPRSSTQLDSSARVLATPAAQDLQAYLRSAEPAGRRFELPSIRFVQGPHVREDPDGSIATLVAVLNAHPKASVIVEVTHANPQMDVASESSSDRARRVADVFIRNGLPPERVTSRGLNTPVSQVPRVYLTVREK